MDQHAAQFPKPPAPCRLGPAPTMHQPTLFALPCLLAAAVLLAGERAVIFLNCHRFSASANNVQTAVAIRKALEQGGRMEDGSIVFFD